jgi:hypothetical protein
VSARGCLAVILTFVAILIGVLWVALPPVVGGLAAAVITNAGVHGTDTRVDVGADPPLRLLFLEADRARLRSTDVQIRNLHADSIDVTLRDVSIGRQRFGFIEGGMTGVRVTQEDGSTFEAAEVQITGPAEAARVVVTVDGPAIRRMIAERTTAFAGATAGLVTLASPDRVTVALPRGTLTGRLEVTAAGELVIVPTSGGRIGLLATGPDQPVRLKSVQVAGDGLELGGVIDLVP